jgi:hypothetical protein
LYYLQSRYYDPEVCRFINADDPGALGADGRILSYNLFSYCQNSPVLNYDPTGHFLLTTAVIIGAVVGGIIGASIGGTAAYHAAKTNGAEGWELAGWTALGALGGGLIGSAIGAAIGYGIGYLAGGTYANGLVAKTVDNGIHAFLSQANKVHHVVSNVEHALVGDSVSSLEKLMRITFAHGTVSTYRTVQSVFWALKNSEVTFKIVDGTIKISDMWIR